jgi:uncharacterized membrane protein
MSVGLRIRSLALAIVLITLSVKAAPALAFEKGWPHSFWQPLLIAPHRYIHPLVIHFPIVFLSLEAALLFLNKVMKSKGIWKSAKILLYLAALSLPFVMLAGLHDVGVDIAHGNAILDGLNDRIKNWNHWSDRLSLHFAYAVVLTLFVWLRTFLVAQGKGKFVSTWANLGLALIVIWIMTATAQLGGSLSYP